MTITMDEKWQSGGLSLFSADFTAILRGTDDYVTALTEAAGFVPNTFFNGVNLLYLTNIGKIERIAEQTWLVPFEYGSAQAAQQEQQKNGESDFARSFEIGGGTVRITHSKETVNSYVPSGQTATDFEQGINVTETGVEGCDIYAGPSVFTETRNYSSSTHDALCGVLEELKFHVNSAPFLGRPVGTVLYIGASGGFKNLESFGSVTHKFLYSENVSGVSIGTINSILKRGHDFLWTRSKEEVDNTTKRVKLIPSQVNIERVYGYLDLNNIPNINSY